MLADTELCANTGLVRGLEAGVMDMYGLLCLLTNAAIGMWV